MGDRERRLRLVRHLRADVSRVPPAAPRLETLPPLGLVEGRPAWPELADDADDLLERAGALAAAAADGSACVAAAVVAGAAVARLALRDSLTADRAEELVAWSARASGRGTAETRVAVFGRALFDVAVAAPSRPRALDAALQCLCALAPARSARLEPQGEGARAAAGPGTVVVPVPACDALLVAEAVAGREAACRAFAEETAHVVGAAARLGFAGRGGEAQARKLAAAERRLRRLALDLHDGPAQDVAALAADAAVLEADLAAAADDPQRLAESLELAGEIRSRLAALGRDIRDLAEVLEPRAILRAPLRDVLAREAAVFARRAGFAPELDVDDDLGAMTASQQIALARVAREALTNVREHASASAVRLAATATADGVSLVVTDDGRGFDVEGAEAASGGLGLRGMHDRVRLLGGRLVVESRPGGPTRVAATIPRWRPSS